MEWPQDVRAIEQTFIPKFGSHFVFREKGIVNQMENLKK